MDVAIGLPLAVALVAYNGATNLLPFPRWLYLPVNLLLTAVLVLLGLRWRLDVGLSTDGWEFGIAIAGTVLVGCGAVLLVARHRRSLRRRLRDGRTAGWSVRQVAYHTLLRIPLGTALFEEVAFRGVLLALVGVWWQAVAFGLWHVGPTIAALRANDRRPAFRPVATAVVTTAVGGVAFGWLRVATDGILAPVFAHWSFNAGGVLVTVTAARWTRSSNSRSKNPRS